MKNLISSIKSESVCSYIALAVILVTCVSIVVLVAYYGNGVYSTDFVVRG